MANNTDAVIVLCQSADNPQDVNLRRGETLVFRSPTMEATLTFKPDPFEAQQGTYTIPQGQERGLTVSQEASSKVNYAYDIECGGATRKADRPRIIINDDKAI